MVRECSTLKMTTAGVQTGRLRTLAGSSFNKVSTIATLRQDVTSSSLSSTAESHRAVASGLQTLQIYGEQQEMYRILGQV